MLKEILEKVDPEESEKSEKIKVNTQAICDQAKLLSPENQAKVFALVLQLQD